MPSMLCDRLFLAVFQVMLSETVGVGNLVRLCCFLWWRSATKFACVCSLPELRCGLCG